jgi:hypothetical protein
MITVLLPLIADDHERQLKSLIERNTLPPFDPLVIDFIDSVSKSVLLDKVMCRMPEMAAVAHWMRKGHLAELCASFKERQGNRVWVARGMVLHFAPSNVDSIFLYSWFLSMLAGNSNVLRLSHRRREEVRLILEKINLLMEESRFQPIKAGSLILAYEHDDAITQRLSQVCQVRVLWGGDESVRRLRAIPMNPLGMEVVFPSRFSLAMLNATEVSSADESALSRLAENFCNDSYWFDQKACSSPRLVVWVGESSNCDFAKRRFWSRVQEEITKRNIQYPEVVGIDKLVTAYVSAGLGVADSMEANLTGNISRVHLAPDATPEFRNLECGGGFFFESEVPDLTSLAGLLSQRDQTLSYFGFRLDEIREFALALPARAVDRIVPIGSALTFSTVWDGADLLATFCREIDIQ